MYYIQRLKKENQELKEKLNFLSKEIDSFNSFLHSSKFTGDENGERKDWIATGDVIQTVRGLRTLTVLD